MKRHMTLLMAACLLSSCMTHASMPTEDRPAVQKRGPAPEGAPDGTCWDKYATPAIIETTTEQIVDQSLQRTNAGTYATGQSYRTETRQRIVREREEHWVEIPCPEAMTPEFYASLQRALKARGYFNGPITADYSLATRSAVRRYQRENGLDTHILAIKTARDLGLVAIPRY